MRSGRLLVTEKENLVSILNELCEDAVLRPGHWALAGSGVMVLHDLERNKPMGDVDIFMATRDWIDVLYRFGSAYGWRVFTTEPDDFKRRCDPPYLYKVIEGLEVNIFSQWRVRGIGDIDVNFWLHNVEEVEGWPCVPLRCLFDWKRAVGRAKDMDDIRVMSEYLKEA